NVSTLTRFPVIRWQDVMNPYQVHPLASADEAAFSPGSNYEQHVTYPVFFRGSDGSFLFRYRIGNSGNGDTWVARFDRATQVWTRAFDGPVLSWDDDLDPRLSVYHSSVFAVGRWYTQFVFRPKIDEVFLGKYLGWASSGTWGLDATGQSDWYNAGGQRIPLPIRQTSDVIVDQSEKGGVWRTSSGFDYENRPMLAYSINDALGHIGVRIARFENGAWHIVQLAQYWFDWSAPGAGDPLAFWIDGPIAATVGGQ